MSQYEGKNPWLSKTFLTSLFLGIGGFLYGYDSGIITPSLALTSFNKHFEYPPPPLRGSIVSMYQAGGESFLNISASTSRKLTVPKQHGWVVHQLVSPATGWEDARPLPLGVYGVSLAVL